MKLSKLHWYFEIRISTNRLYILFVIRYIWTFQRHLKGKPHAELGEMLNEQHEMITNLLRQQASLVERRKAIVNQKTAKFKNQNREIQMSTCNMCQVEICGFNSVADLRTHRQSYGHQMLKEFLHPKCTSCNLEFQGKCILNYMLSYPAKIYLKSSR